MKTKVYMRLAKNTPSGRSRYKVDASPNPNPRPLTIGFGRSERELHTLHFALELDIPEELLSPAKWPVVEIQLSPDLVQQVPIAVEPAEAS